MAEIAAAWTESVFASLPHGARSIVSTGHFVESEGGAAVFALDNVHARDHCEKHRPSIEDALSAHFGRRIPVRLVALAAPPSPAKPGRQPKAPAQSGSDEEEDVADVHALENAPTAASSAERLAEAFPGAELLDEA